MIPFEISIKESNRYIVNEIKKAARLYIAKELKKIVIDINKDIKRDLADIFRQTPIYFFLTNGPLDAHFGFENGTASARVESILSVLSQEVYVEHVPTQTLVSDTVGFLKVYAIRGDFARILAMPESVVQTEKGEILPWLEWLLLYGDKVMIAEHDIVFADSDKSRSGKAFMIKGDAKSWKIPSTIGGQPVTGILSNNWLTRAVEASEAEIKKILESIIKRRL